MIRGLMSRRLKREFEEGLGRLGEYSDFDLVLDMALGADTYGQFKRAVYKKYPDFPEDELEYIWYGNGEYEDPASYAYEGDSRGVMDYDAVYGNDVYSIGRWD